MTNEDNMTMHEDDEECLHFGRVLLFAGECTLCSGKADSLRPPEQYAWDAKYPGRCSARCGRAIEIGDRITLQGARAVHEECFRG